jgi:hypothetical protein
LIRSDLEQAIFLLAIFHHIVDDISMKVVEKDRLISDMLREELVRCRNMSASLEQVLSSLPKGSLHLRSKDYHGKSYSYHYVKFRERGKSVSRHISSGQVGEVQKQLQTRKSYEQELKTYRARIRYLEKILLHQG